MSFRGLRLAAQFLTRLPVPGVADFSPVDLARSATWFPFVGLALGVVVALVTFAIGHRSAALAGVVGVLAWVWLTGAIHLDGLADLADALGASHRDPQRFLAVLEDPHAGTFGIVSIVLTLMLKAAALSGNYSFFDPHDSFLCNHQTPCALFKPDHNLHLTDQGYDLITDLLQKFVAQDRRQ